jgi:hypothetical protein
MFFGVRLPRVADVLQSFRLARCARDWTDVMRECVGQPPLGEVYALN